MVTADISKTDGDAFIVGTSYDPTQGVKFPKTQTGAPDRMASGGGFFEALEARVQAVDSLLCVGLDPHAAQVRP